MGNESSIHYKCNQLTGKSTTIRFSEVSGNCSKVKMNKRLTKLFTGLNELGSRRKGWWRRGKLTARSRKKR